MFLQAIKAEVGELEAFMSKVHEEGMEFLRMTKPYTVQETSQLPTEDDQGSDTESSFVSVPTSSGFIDQWNYLKHRLEKRQAKIMSVLSNNVPTLNAASSSQRIAFTVSLIDVGFVGDGRRPCNRLRYCNQQIHCSELSAIKKNYIF